MVPALRCEGGWHALAAFPSVTRASHQYKRATIELPRSCSAVHKKAFSLRLDEDRTQQARNELHSTEGMLRQQPTGTSGRL